MANLMESIFSAFRPKKGKEVLFVDIEAGVHDKRIHDIGALRADGTIFRSPNRIDFDKFAADAQILCGHNIVHHDMTFLRTFLTKKDYLLIDTLYWSPLLFPKKPYHSLLKDDKILQDDINNPVCDAQKAKKLYYDELSAFSALDGEMQEIFCRLLKGVEEFDGFIETVSVGYAKNGNLANVIAKRFSGLICANANLENIIKNKPVELAYALAIINTSSHESLTPPWVLKRYPAVESILNELLNSPCHKPNCKHCQSRLDVRIALKRLFGFDSFRTYNGEPLQENAARAAVEGDSLIAVFPTGGGKSITFQVPALMAGEAVHGLTVVISPLQSLMKDQVDNLNERGITEAVTLNGLLNPIERADAFRRVEEGLASILYISPEQLRSKTVENMLLRRNVVRFVIDEAHCFSAWGQDFRVDYLYIGDFIKHLMEQKGGHTKIPVSCFTATAKQKVISDIRDYFHAKLNVELKIFASKATRENLHYVVLHEENKSDKYATLRNLIEQKACPTIVYVARIKATQDIADRLTDDGFPALPFNGKMDPKEKIENQEKFIRNEVQIIVATSAFGMGVDKKDVRLVVHFDISDSLENYLQEAGRAGRDPSLQADCYVLYCDDDLDKHFVMLNQTKLSLNDIQMVWRAIKKMSPSGKPFCSSALEIARAAGWDDSVGEIETRVKTAIAALEGAGYVKRGQNVPRVYATSILAASMSEAADKISRSKSMDESQRLRATLIVRSLISARSIARSGIDDAESRVDYLADILGMEKRDVIEAINLMRKDEILADTQDMAAIVLGNDTNRKSLNVLLRFSKTADALLDSLTDEVTTFNLKALNEGIYGKDGNANGVKCMRTLIRFWATKGWLKKSERPDCDYIKAAPTISIDKLRDKLKRMDILAEYAINYLYAKVESQHIKADVKIAEERQDVTVGFSLVGITKDFNSSMLEFNGRPASLNEMSDALLYLTRIGAMRLEGGFLVLYNAFRLKRLVMDNKRQFRKDDYRVLDEYYRQKTQQIHIVGEFANLMVRDYNAALRFVHDYFHEDYRKFIEKYFAGDRAKEIDKGITSAQRKRIFDRLTAVQEKILSDDKSEVIIIAAGPGSGKTSILVRKLASLIMMEDVKHERLLMLTFSRAATTVFKSRLKELIGSPANYVEIKTFHSYCFDLTGKVGNLTDADNVVKMATDMIESGEVEQQRIAKSVLVIDEAQDMDEDASRLVRALMKANESMRIIAVGDDDQNIFGFRGSDSRYLKQLKDEPGARFYEMTTNFRSDRSIVALSNAYVHTMSGRMKSTPICAKTGAPQGSTKLIKHIYGGFEYAVAEECTAEHFSGETCILTSTNDQALRVFSALLQKGADVRLVNSNDGFKLANLAEIRYFLRYIKTGEDLYTISNEVWDSARKRLSESYRDSACLKTCLKMIDSFAQTQNSKYMSDFERFLAESRYEDFPEDKNATFTVSTIHKSKGKEYDSVYMILDGQDTHEQVSEERKRAIYVGMTRAKHNLRIHYADDILFRDVDLTGVEHIVDNSRCRECSEAIVQMSYHDVVLDFFRDKKQLLLQLRSGARLNVDGEYLSAQLGGRSIKIVKFSKSFKGKLAELTGKGYVPYSASIRFIVAWKAPDDESETAVILPDLLLRKQAQPS